MRAAPSSLFAVLAVACSSARAPAPAPPPRAEPPPAPPVCPTAEAEPPPAPPDAPEPPDPPTPVELGFGEGSARRSLVVTFHGASSRPPLPGFVASVRLDGATVFPPDCAASKADLCALAHRELRGETPHGRGTPDHHGKGAHVRLVTHEAGDDRAYALFASTTHGSPECGIYGYWVLRADAKGARVTPPVTGCFQSVHQVETTLVSPRVAWTSPPLLWLENPSYGPNPLVTIFALDEAAMTLSKKAEGRSRALDALLRPGK